MNREEIVKIVDEARRRAQMRILCNVLARMEIQESKSWETAKDIIEDELNRLKE